ncbi:MAG: PIN domain-containing protein [Chloroflexi bacterium]|nr:PIN domain-containing protein [Chloroflexota bacterium]
MTVIVDTSFIVSLINPAEAAHDACIEVALRFRDAFIVPLTILPEVAYLVESRLGHALMRQTIQELLRPSWIIATPVRADLVRAIALLEQYADAHLDFVDATVIAMAERLRVRQVLTLDRRHFHMVRPLHCDGFEVLP